MPSVLKKKIEIVKVFPLSWYLAVSIKGVKVVLRFTCFDQATIPRVWISERIFREPIIIKVTVLCSSLFITTDKVRFRGNISKGGIDVMRE